jgi:hypothetical protein
MDTTFLTDWLRIMRRRDVEIMKQRPIQSNVEIAYNDDMVYIRNCASLHQLYTRTNPEIWEDTAWIEYDQQRTTDVLLSIIVRPMVPVTQKIKRE